MVTAVKNYDLILRGATKELLIATLRKALNQNFELLTYIALIALLREAILKVDYLC
jgi:hypothetical protein